MDSVTKDLDKFGLRNWRKREGKGEDCNRAMKEVNSPHRAVTTNKKKNMPDFGTDINL